MLNITQIQDDDVLTKLDYVSSWGPGVDGIIIFPANPSVFTKDMVGWLDEGPENPLGDRDCHHTKADGDIFITPPGMVTNIGGEAQKGQNLFPVYKKTYSGPEVIPYQNYSIKPSSKLSTILTAHLLIKRNCSGSLSFPDFSYTNKYYTYTIRGCKIQWSWPRTDRLIVHGVFHYHQVQTRSGTVINDYYDHWGCFQNFVLSERGLPIKTISGLMSVTEEDKKSDSIRWSAFADPVPSNSMVSYAVAGYGKDFSNDDINFIGIAHMMSALEHNLPTLPYGIWGDLAQTATEDARELDINSVLFLKDFMEIKSLLKPYKLLKKIPNLKNLSSAYLSEHYGISLTLSDSLTVIKTLSEVYNSRLYKGTSHTRAMTCVPSTQRDFNTYLCPKDILHYKIYYNPVDSTWTGVVKKLMDWDFFPTLQNCWDFIPYSFVVNWFIDVQSGLERIDTKTYISVLDVKSVLKSRKTIYSSVPLKALSLCRGGKVAIGHIDITIYSRWSQLRCDLPPVRLDVPNGFHNFVEAAALLLQRH